MAWWSCSPWDLKRVTWSGQCNAIAIKQTFGWWPLPVLFLGGLPQATAHDTSPHRFIAPPHPLSLPQHILLHSNQPSTSSLLLELLRARSRSSSQVPAISLRSALEGELSVPQLRIWFLCGCGCGCALHEFCISISVFWDAILRPWVSGAKSRRYFLRAATSLVVAFSFRLSGERCVFPFGGLTISSTSVAFPSTPALLPSFCSFFLVSFSNTVQYIRTSVKRLFGLNFRSWLWLIRIN